jgi:hypothetical protein
MSVTVQQVYDRVTAVMLEDGGFVLGVFSQSQFLEVFGVVILDFAQRAALVKNIFTTPIYAGVPQYIVPDDVMKPELCFVGGKIIEKVFEVELMTGHFEWRRQWGPPRQWHEDNLAPKRLELFPKPDFNGASYPGDTPPIGKYGDFFPADHNLTMVGPAAPDQATWALGDPIQDVPDSFCLYLAYGVLAQIFGADGETRDAQRALYCRTRYEEGISLADAISREELLEDDD